MIAAPVTTGPAGYYYATGFITPTSSVSAQFDVENESLGSNLNNHSLTEIYVQDTAGNAVELGVMTDTDFWGTSKPVLFTDTWDGSGGNLTSFNGYDSSQNGFVQTGSIGNGTPESTGWKTFGLSYSNGRMNVSVNGQTIGYYPSSFWSGGWGKAKDGQVYGEVYSYGGTLPTMNGAIRDVNDRITYSGGASAPYKQTNESSSGFTFSGPA
jgi:hypothetical protein